MTITTSNAPASTGRTTSPAMLAAWAVTVLLCAAGLVGLVLRFVGGHEGADYGSYVPWGLWIAAYVTLIGASAGAFALSAVIFGQRLRPQYPVAITGMLVALGAFAAGMVNVWLDLGHPFRAWKMFFSTSFSSVMGWMAWFYAAYGVLLLVGLVIVWRKGVTPLLERFAWVAFLFAVVFAGAEGALFGVVGARPLWESGLTPVLFLVEAALFGVGLVLAVAVLFGVVGQTFAKQLGKVLLVLIAILLVLEWAEFSTGLTASVPAKSEALKTILTGEYWWVFWIAHLGLGLLVPAAIILLSRGRLVWLGAAAGLIAVMGIASKLNLLLPALAQEELEGLEDAFTGPGLTYDYFPSLMEWLVWLGTLGLTGLIILGGRPLLASRLDRATEPAVEASPVQETELS